MDFIFQPNLYPTVGLQTPGEVIEANFGQSPFVYDIEDYMKVSGKKKGATDEIYCQTLVSHKKSEGVKSKSPHALKKIYSGTRFGRVWIPQNHTFLKHIIFPLLSSSFSFKNVLFLQTNAKSQHGFFKLYAIVH